MEEAGEAGIYKLNLLEAMIITEESWKAVSKESIAHCWNHTKIQPVPLN